MEKRLKREKRMARGVKRRKWRDERNEKSRVMREKRRMGLMTGERKVERKKGWWRGECRAR